jgi:hypothetical protein
MLFPDVGTSEFKIGGAISLIIIYLGMAMFFAFAAPFVYKLLKMNKLLVGAAGVGLELSLENT